MTNFEPYTHYKGGKYLKMHEALHTETEEVLVVYACAKSGRVFARPKAMFEENVIVDNKPLPRFEKIAYTPEK